jgi:GT2 family glycosyltransferase
MQPNRSSNIARTIDNARLLATIHLDGFRSDPRAYLKAVMWWLLRKRVRARGQLAPLLSRSPNAYIMWALRDTYDPPEQTPPGQNPPIIALVAAGASQAALNQTLLDLAAEDVQPFVISVDHGADLGKAASAIDWRQSPWLLAMRAGDRLAPGAAAAYRRVMQETYRSVLYADDDVLDKFGRRTNPHFKPDWNYELYRHFDFLTGAAIVRAAQVDLTDIADDPNWNESLISRAVANGGAHHVRHMLHHRSVRPASPLKPAPLTIAASLPPISIIIPTRNRLDLLRTCLEGVAATAYSDLEVIVVDNDSDDPATLAYLAEQERAGVQVLRHKGPFNYSAINNRAVAQARGQLLCLLNNDIEVLSPDWLAIMATQALRDDVGAVGAQLLYPDGRIQHAGVVIGVGNAAGHAHRFVQPQAEGYFRRHALPQFTAAVTGACLVVARERFLAVGGLDERNFAVAFNDVDLCLRLNQHGWQSLYEPRAVLIHHESVSRGHDRDPVGAARFAGELAALQRLWKTDSIVDPFHHPHLSRASEQFSVAL